MRLLVIALALVAVLVIGVFASGSTFGQRCDKLHPNGTALERERCVTNLSHGIQP